MSFQDPINDQFLKITNNNVTLSKETLAKLDLKTKKVQTPHFSTLIIYSSPMTIK